MTDTYLITEQEQAEADYLRWTQSWLFHIDQIPALLETIALMAAPTIRASQTDKIVVTGGNYRDYAPISDTGAANDLDTLWAETRGYVLAVADNLGHCPAPTTDRPLWQGHTRASHTPHLARIAGYTATNYLAEHVHHVIDWPHLATHEDHLFARIRRMKGRYRAAATPRRAHPRTCTTCGEDAVLIDWVTPTNGSPKPVQVGVCKRCGETFTEDPAGS